MVPGVGSDGVLVLDLVNGTVAVGDEHSLFPALNAVLGAAGVIGTGHLVSPLFCGALGVGDPSFPTALFTCRRGHRCQQYQPQN